MAVNLRKMIDLLANNDPRRVYEDFIENDVEFKRFIERNKDKTTEQMIQSFNLEKVIGE